MVWYLEEDGGIYMEEVKKFRKGEVIFKEGEFQL